MTTILGPSKLASTVAHDASNLFSRNVAAYLKHALQLMHHKQTHSLPESERELAYLARRWRGTFSDHLRAVREEAANE